MAIVRVATTEQAHAARNAHGIPQGKGALILDAALGGEPKHLLEKLLKGQKFTGQPVDQLIWKLDPLVIVVGDGGEQLLDGIEAICPGFTAKVS